MLRDRESNGSSVLLQGMLSQMKSCGTIAMLFLLAITIGCASTPTAPPPQPTPPTSVQAGTTTVVAVAPAAQPCCKKPTLPECLGLTGLGRGIAGAFHRLFSRLITGLDLTGRFPGLQPQDPLVPITDPANMAPDAPPALQAAAAAKEEEDSAKQKIMALRYLATLGCGGCYEKVEEGLLSALDDCTEEVRFEAVSALRGKSAYNCRFCKSSRCCSDKIRRKLNEVAYDVDVNGCYKEPSARVRRVARLALAACCGPVYSEGETIPSEGPPDPEAPAGPVEEPAVALGEPPPLFEGIQLVRFETDAQAILGTDPLLAQVDGEPIYESHVRVVVDARLAALKQSPIISTDDARWRQLMPLELQRLITWKLLYIEARKELRAPGSASANMPLSAAEVQQWFQWRTSGDPNISPQEMAAYFELHRSEFDAPTRVRWEHILVRKSRFNSREEALRVAEYLQNRAQGVQLPEVPFDRQQVDVKTNPLEPVNQIQPFIIQQTVQSQPIGQVSPLIEDGEGFHIVRVLDRETGGRAEYARVTEQIRQAIYRERRESTEKQFLARLRTSHEVWMFSDEAPKSVRLPPVAFPK